MNVNDFVQDLAASELSNLSLLDSTLCIKPTKEREIYNYLNKGLLALHTRFLLKEKPLKLLIVDGIDTYILDKSHSIHGSGSQGGDLYIEDTSEDPFQDDIIRIIAVLDPENRKLGLNDDYLSCDIITPQSNVIKITKRFKQPYLIVKYQASHPDILMGDTESEIQLPKIFIPALSYFIAWKMYSGMNTAEAVNIAMMHRNSYESICQRIMEQDVVKLDPNIERSPFEERGWV